MPLLTVVAAAAQPRHSPVCPSQLQGPLLEAAAFSISQKDFKDASIGSGDSEVTWVRRPSPVKTHEHLSRVGITFSLCNPGAVWVQCWWGC